MSFQYFHPKAYSNVGLRICIDLQVLASGIRIAIAMSGLQLCSRPLTMLGELTNIPTDTLIDMLYLILAEESVMTATDAGEIEQIQRELQRRGVAHHWSCGAVS